MWCRTWCVLTGQGKLPRRPADRLSPHAQGIAVRGPVVTFEVPADHHDYPYFAPEYRRRGETTYAGDVYCLGLLILELIGGGLLGQDWASYVADFTSVTAEERELFVDDRVSWDSREAHALANLAARCLVADPAARPALQELLPARHNPAARVPGVEQHVSSGTRCKQAAEAWGLLQPVAEAAAVAEAHYVSAGRVYHRPAVTFRWSRVFWVCQNASEHPPALCPLSAHSP